MQSNSTPTEIKAKVVVIDDDRSILDLTALILSKHGYKVFTASTAQDGMEIVATHAPELVLLDYMMPGMDGLTALKEIKSHFPDIYVVMFTGKGSEEIAVELMKGGASEYILKPFNNRDLSERLDKVLRIREIELHNKALQKEHERLLQEIEEWNQELQQRVREKTEALKRAQTEIAQSEKLATLGYLAAGMAHDIRNPLNSIALFIQLISRETLDAEQQDYLTKALKEIDRIDLSIRKLLDVSQRTRIISKNVQIDQVIENSLETFLPQIETGKIAVTRVYRVVPPPIKADPAELEQIFTNLFLNALEEMTEGGCLQIEIDAKDGLVIVMVGDNGKGISVEALPNIFDPFFTTKSRGTGMGLPVVQRIARIYEGEIAVERTSSEGTVFRLEFPVCQ
ncbi:MAG TPA: response regulator [Desulfuromonadaceae bacterium]|jgi:signal transduction histidine kinase